jgi:hypothetical protein
MRQKEGLSEYTRQKLENDNALYGLEELLINLVNLDNVEKIKRTELIWKELNNLYERRGESVFSGIYSFRYSYLSRNPRFDAYFIRLLNKSAWIPDSDGILQIPGNVLFNSLGWEDNIFLRSKIQFKSDEIQEFEKKTGYKAVRHDEYEQFKKWHEAQKTQPNSDEKQQKEFTPTFSVADTPLKVTDFNGKEQSVPFDISQIDKSTSQSSNNNSLLDIGEYINNQTSSNNSGAQSKDSNIDSEYQKQEGRYGENCVLKLLKDEYKDDNIEIIDLNLTGKPGVGADFVIKNKISGKIIKLIEVKSTTGQRGSEQRISGKQWETARHYFKTNEGDLYWVYCVYNVNNTPEIVRVQNPIKKWSDGLIFADPVDFVIKEK